MFWIILFSEKRKCFLPKNDLGDKRSNYEVCLNQFV